MSVLAICGCRNEMDEHEQYSDMRSCDPELCDMLHDLKLIWKNNSSFSPDNYKRLTGTGLLRKSL